MGREQDHSELAGIISFHRQSLVQISRLRDGRAKRDGLMKLRWRQLNGLGMNERGRNGRLAEEFKA